MRTSKTYYRSPYIKARRPSSRLSNAYEFALLGAALLYLLLQNV